MKTLFSKILVRFLLISLIIIIIFGFSMIYFFENFYFENKQQEIIHNNSVVSGFLSQAIVRNNIQQMENWLEILANLNEGQAWLINYEGYLELSYPLTHEQGRKINYQYHDDIINGRIVSSRIESQYFERPMLLIGMPVVKPDGENFSLLVFTSVAGINQTISQVQNMMFYSSLFAILLAMVVAYRWSKSLSSPLQKMSKVALKISKGNYGQTVAINEKNEVGTLAESFNYMSKKLAVTVDNLVEEKNKLKYILTGMEEGVLVINEQQEIILINKAAKKILAVDLPLLKNKNLKDLKIKADIIDVFMDSLREDKVIKKELFLEKEITNSNLAKRLSIHCTPIYAGEEFLGVAALIQDISKRWRFEKLQKEFVANVSHELKTPLSSIKGAGELIIDQVISKPEQIRDYLSIIIEESNRLEELVNNILDLSKLESETFENKFKLIDINKLINNTVAIFKKKIKGKRDLKVFLDDKELYIKGNAKRLKQVLLNLLDNAYKFSPEDTDIIVGSIKDNNKIKIWVKDEGIGIPEKEIENIWERFYQVEKAHTPSDRSSGLGLAIVKNIIEKHEGKVYVKSQPGNGSEFGFHLPVCQKKQEKY